MTLKRTHKQQNTKHSVSSPSRVVVVVVAAAVVAGSGCGGGGSFEKPPEPRSRSFQNWKSIDYDFHF